MCVMLLAIWGLDPMSSRRVVLAPLLACGAEEGQGMKGGQTWGESPGGHDNVQVMKIIQGKDRYTSVPFPSLPFRFDIRIVRRQLEGLKGEGKAPERLGALDALASHSAEGEGGFAPGHSGLLLDAMTESGLLSNSIVSIFRRSLFYGGTEGQRLANWPRQAPDFVHGLNKVQRPGVKGARSPFRILLPWIHYYLLIGPSSKKHKNKKNSISERYILEAS